VTPLYPSPVPFVRSPVVGRLRSVGSGFVLPPASGLASPGVNLVESLRLPGLEGALYRVEACLADATAGEDPFLTEVASHLARAGGKRLRPALVIAAAKACGTVEDGDDDPDLSEPDLAEGVILGAVAVELVHLGSLYHDDVMDEAESRRGVDSVNTRWGNLVAILAGDFLLARASEIAASLGTEVAALLARTISELCEGEVGQLRYSFDISRSEAAYFSSIGGKTASLMAASARIGALVSGAPRAWIDAMTSYGRSIGMTFQIWDDVRDLTSSEGVLGKPAGHDMVEGTYTLPVIRALQADGIGQDLGALLGGPLDGPSRDKARDLVLASDAIDWSMSTARRWADLAESSLLPLRQASGLRSGLAEEHLDVLAQVGHRLLDEIGFS
jgi:heptaprenyl diphosphate synthase